jgi:HEAT repeat protein
MKRTQIIFISGVLAACAFFVFGCDETQREQRATGDEIRDTSGLLPQASRIIEDGLSDEDPQIKVMAIEVVAETQQKKLMPRVQQLLKDDFVPVRFAAAVAVGDMQYALAKGTVEQLQQARDENTRIAAAYAMYKLGSLKGLEVIRKAIASNDATIRANSAVLLGKSGDKESIKQLYWVMTDSNSDDKTRFQAAEAIARLGDEKIIKKLWTMIISTYADDRMMGLNAMGALGTPTAKDILITKLDDEVLEVRLTAAEQLGRLGSSSGEAVVLSVFTKEAATAGLDKRDMERVKVLAALAIGQIGTKPVTRYLPELLQNESKFVRIAAAKAVFQCSAKN